MHDVSRAHYHVKDIDIFGKILGEAAAAALSSRGRPQYKAVFVLLLIWGDDNLGVIDEILELKQVFQEDYGFDTEVWSIPSFQPQTLLVKKIGELVRLCNSSETLFIIYYGGHGTKDEETCQAVWTSSVIFTISFRILIVLQYQPSGLPQNVLECNSSYIRRGFLRHPHST